MRLAPIPGRTRVGADRKLAPPLRVAVAFDSGHQCEREFGPQPAVMSCVSKFLACALQELDTGDLRALRACLSTASVAITNVVPSSISRQRQTTSTRHAAPTSPSTSVIMGAASVRIIFTPPLQVPRMWRLFSAFQNWPTAAAGVPQIPQSTLSWSGTALSNRRRGR